MLNATLVHWENMNLRIHWEFEYICVTLVPVVHSPGCAGEHEHTRGTHHLNVDRAGTYENAEQIRQWIHIVSLLSTKDGRGIDSESDRVT